MIKLIIVGAVAFVLAMAGGVGFVVMTAEPPQEDSPDAEAAETEGEHASAEGRNEENAPHSDSGSQNPTGGDPAAAEHRNEASHGETSTESDPTGHPREGSKTTERALSAANKSTPSDKETYETVARIMNNMSPEEASKIMSFLSDKQVEGILRDLGIRQAAAMLTAMPAERAARLSRRLMHPESEEE